LQGLGIKSGPMVGPAEFCHYEHRIGMFMQYQCAVQNRWTCPNSRRTLNDLSFLLCDAIRCMVLLLVIVILSVRLSICLSHSCTVSTWFDL